LNPTSSLHDELSKAWKNSHSLTAVTGVMLTASFFSLLAVAFDSDVITGAPAWMKPTKFAISSALYAGTLAWMFQFISVWPRFVRRLGATTAAVLVLEVGIIDIQAFRGTTSHFNIGTPLDAALWGTMGTAIGILWLASAGISAALFRQQFRNPTFGWALRLGMLLTVLGSGSGGLMVGPTPEQQAQIAETHRAPAVIGAHTVGAPDGGPGVAGVGWSKKHGDLRIPHFLGLHAIQIIPLLYLLRRRRLSVSSQIRFVFGVAASYLALFCILVWQALRGQSLTEPDQVTGIVLLIWLALSALNFLRPVGAQSHAMEVL
jgi:hypothetical protein